MDPLAGAEPPIRTRPHDSSMTLPGTLLRRHFAPLLITAQALVDVAVIILACYVAYLIGEALGTESMPRLGIYREVWFLIVGICLSHDQEIGRARLQADELRQIGGMADLATALEGLTGRVCLGLRALDQLGQALTACMPLPGQNLGRKLRLDVLGDRRLQGDAETGQAISEAKLAAKVGQTIDVIVDEVDDEAATCRTKADAPEIDGTLFIDEGFEALKPGDIVSVEVDEAGEYDLWGKLI